MKTMIKTIMIRMARYMENLELLLPLNKLRELVPRIPASMFLLKGFPHFVQTRRPARERSARKIVPPQLKHGLWFIKL